MGEGILLNIAAGVSCAALGAILLYATERRVDVYSYYFWGSVFAFVWALLLVRWGALPRADRLPGLAVWMFVAGAFNNAGNLLLYYNLRTGHKAASWAVAMSSLVVPFAVSSLVWQERVSASRMGGMVFVLLGIGLLAGARRDAKTGQINLRWLGLAVANLSCFGLAQTCMGVPSHWAGWSDCANLRTPLSALFCGLQQWGALLFLRRRPERRAVGSALSYSVVYFVALLLTYLALDILSTHGASNIFWPLNAGACIVLFSLYSHLVKRERFSWLDIVGLAGMLSGLLLLADPPNPP